jgi:hypothetical protein
MNQTDFASEVELDFGRIVERPGAMSARSRMGGP